LQEMPGDGAVPELVEASGEAGQGGLQVVANLAVEGGAFANEIAALANEQQQGGPGFIACGFEQSTAGDGGAMDGAEVGVVGLVARIDRLAVLLGNEGMENACLEAGGGEGALHQAVIASGAFDGDEAIAELMLGEGMSDLGHGVVEFGSVVGDRGGRDEDAAIEIGEEELGAEFGTVEADDAEVFGSDVLDARMEQSAGFGDRVVKTVCARAFAGTEGGHESCLREPRMGIIPFSQLALGRGSFNTKTHIPGVLPHFW
jgi:hypothetical protein